MPQLRIRLHAGAADNLQFLLQQLWPTVQLTATPLGALTELLVELAALPEPAATDIVGCWLGNLDTWALVETRLADRPWVAGWDAWLPELPVGRFVVRPLPLVGQPTTKEEIRFQSGGCFGSGWHPTTQATIDVLLPLLDTAPPTTLLDVGCGSGLLTLLAAKRGWLVVAVDDCEAAVLLTEVNCQRNGVRRVLLRHQDAGAPLPAVDAVVANLPPGIWARALDQLARSARQHLVLGGIPAGELALPARRLPEFVVAAHATRGEWSALWLVRQEVRHGDGDGGDLLQP